MNSYLQAAIGFMAASGFTAWTSVVLCGAAKLTAHHRAAKRPPAHCAPASPAAGQAQQAREANQHLTEALEHIGAPTP